MYYILGLFSPLNDIFARRGFYSPYHSGYFVSILFLHDRAILSEVNIVAEELSAL